MNLSPEWVAYLSGNEIDTTHWSSLGNARAPDEEIIQYAAQHGYAVLTGDLDFGIAVVTLKRAAPSVVQIRGGGTLPEIIGEKVLEALRAGKDSLLRGALVTVDPHRTRVRLL